MTALRTFRFGFFVGVRDFTSYWGWKSWFGGWMVQMIAQAVFFSLLARLFESPDQERFLLIGYAVAVGAANVAWTIQSTAWDRWMGTYPLLVIAPSSLAPAVMGRTSIWLPAGVATTLLTLSFMAIVFDLALPWPAAIAVVPLVVLTSLSTYCFSLFLGALVIRIPGARNFIHSVITIGARAFCGVSVPVSFWPEGVQIVVQVLPITHGLQAIRLLFDEAPATQVLISASLELAVALGWITLALIAMDRMANAGRADGSIEFV